MNSSWLCSSAPREVFYLITVTLLTLLLPLSFLLLSRLSTLQYYLQTLTFYYHHYSPPYLLSLALRISPSLLYILVSILTLASFIHAFTGNITIFTRSSSSSSSFQPRLYTAWILLCAFQVCVGLGIEGSIQAGFYDDDEDEGGFERSLLSRVVFLLGLHETTHVWSKMVVRPVVDDTVFGGVGPRKERWVERAVMAASLGTLWWWKLREDVETLVMMVEVKKEQFMDVGIGDFIGWCLYYVTVTIGIIKIVKALMWICMISLCRIRRRTTSISMVETSEDNGGKSNTLLDAYLANNIVLTVNCSALSSFPIRLRRDMEINEPLSSTPFNFAGFQGGYRSFNIQHEEVVLQQKQSFSAIMELDGGDNLFNDQTQQHHQHDHDHDDNVKVDGMILEDVNFAPDGDALQPISQEFQAPSSLAIASSLELLTNYGSKFKKLSGENISDNFSSIIIESSTCSENQRLSTEEIMRVAGARYVHYSAHWNNDDFSIPTHHYGLDIGNLSEQENRDVELAQFLLAAAERVGCHQFERASRLLLHCQWKSDVNANAAQRVIFHFAEALRERINKETGRTEVGITSSCYDNQNQETEMLQKMSINGSLNCHQKMPFNQVMQFTGVQTMVEHLASETKIHLIDLDIKSGAQCTALMQALVERKECCVESLKVSAIGTSSYKNKIEDTGQRLTCFAESLNLPFSYKAVIVSDLAEIKLDDFDVDDDEAVAVYAPYFLRTLISRPNCLENLMLVIRNIKPCIMIVLEIDSNHNSPSFVNRFIGTLFFCSAFFDCIETCMQEDSESRVAVETVCSVGIRNIVAAEGTERTVRNVKLDVWRRFFARYRMEETGFSESSLYQANLVAREFCFSKFCSVDKDGKSLIISWKGTPMHSLSAWRFV
ncbi:hypothetical protein PIB30_045829 [Stylosanthes scabra]|uniref:Uncharacterized protein n=1 Tax=Stylosanthes scabra TaxID=79078 RepID=A0ABU6TFZ7_9FABA|nr:hypothetical protein [Stylosanthes scabra]